MSSTSDKMDVYPASALRHGETSELTTRLLGSIFLLFPILLYIPGSLYFANTDEFTLRLTDLTLIFLPAFVFSAAVTFALLSIVPRGAGLRLLSLSFALGLLFWLQGSILVWQYGVLDGSDIQWEDHWIKGVVDSPLWLLVIAISLWMPSQFVRIGRAAAAVVVGIQALLLLYATSVDHSRPDEPSARNFSIDYSQQYAYSSNTNVILIVLDAFQSDVYLEIVSEESEYQDIFQGFTYFRNAVAGSNYTELAIPALLTGRVYDNSRPREDFLREAYLEHSVVAQLKRNGFVVDIYPWVGWGNDSIYFDTAIASNLTRIDSTAVREPTFTEAKAKEALYLLDLSIFRIAPHFLKPYVVNDQKWFMSYIATYLVPDGIKQVVSDDSEFTISAMFDQALAELPTTRGEQVFKYYHFSGVHSPLSVNPDLMFTNRTVPFSRENYVLQAKANLLNLERFFARLEAAGIFDRSLIVVVGDHGSGESSEMYIEPPNASREPYRLDGTQRNFRRDKARATPLVLIKPIDAGGELRTSDAPVLSTDIPATIMTELGFETRPEQVSMFAIEPTEPRVRYHSAFEFSAIKSEFVDDITVYRIDGDSWRNESWTVDEIRSANQGGNLP